MDFYLPILFVQIYNNIILIKEVSCNWVQKMPSKEESRKNYEDGARNVTDRKSRDVLWCSFPLLEVICRPCQMIRYRGKTLYMRRALNPTESPVSHAGLIGNNESMILVLVGSVIHWACWVGNTSVIWGEPIHPGSWVVRQTSQTIFGSGWPYAQITMSSRLAKEANTCFVFQNHLAGCRLRGSHFWEDVLNLVTIWTQCKETCFVFSRLLQFSSFCCTQWWGCALL